VPEHTSAQISAGGSANSSRLHGVMQVFEAQVKPLPQSVREEQESPSWPLPAWVRHVAPPVTKQRL
jgi:hypothetical protein